MTERFAQEAGKKRINPLVLVGTGAGVVIVGVILALFVFGIGGGDNVKIDRDRIKVLTGDGAKLIKDGKYDEGIQKYRDALALCDKHPKELAQSKVAIKAEIDSAEKTRTERAAAETAWETLKKEYDDNKYDLKEFREKVRAMRDEHQYLQMPWAQGESQDPRENIKVMYEKVDHQYTEYLAQQGRQGFQAKRQEIIDQFHLNQKGGEDFAGAQRAWKKYRDEAKDSDAKNKAEAQIVDVNRRAYDSWNDLSRKIEGKERDEAVKLLEDTLPRFEGCSFNDVDIAQAIRGKIRTLKEG